MTRISFTQNPNGKLFADTFSDVRLFDAERFGLGNKLQVYLGGMQMGTVEVVAVRRIEFRQISDTLAYLVCGKPAPYLAALLRAYYPTDTLEPYTALHHVVLQWTSRNEEAHGHHLTQWWRSKQAPTDSLQNSNYKQ